MRFLFLFLLLIAPLSADILEGTCGPYALEFDGEEWSVMKDLSSLHKQDLLLMHKSESLFANFFGRCHSNSIPTLSEFKRFYYNTLKKISYQVEITHEEIFSLKGSTVLHVQFLVTPQKGSMQVISETYLFVGEERGSPYEVSLCVTSTVENHAQYQEEIQQFVSGFMPFYNAAE